MFATGRLRTLGPLVALVALSFALRAHWLALSPRELVVDVMPDDAFYYFQIARRLDLGQGITFDGVAPATGLHYAWLFLIAPLFIGAAPGAATPILGALVLATLCFGIAAWLLYVVVEKLTDRWWLAAVAAGAFSVQPWLRRESMNGLETSLSLAAIMAAIWALVRYWEAPSSKRAWAVGGALVLSFFARSDSLVLLAPACLPLLLRAATRRDAARVGGATGAAVAFGSLTNWVRTGSILQSSAAAVPWLFRTNWLRLHPEATSATIRLQSYRFFERAMEMVTLRMGQLPWYAGALSIALIGIAVGWRRERLREIAPRMLTFAGLGLGLLLLVFIHGYVRWLPRSWYFASAPAIGVLVVAAAARTLGAIDARLGLHARRLAGALFVLVAVLDAAQGRLQGQGPTYPWQEEMILAGKALDARVPPGVAVGAFNSGIFGYHAERVVVNLDGIVNEDASRALQAARLLDYMRERNVRYVLDSPGMWNEPRFQHATLHLWGPGVPPPREVERFDVPGVGWPEPTDAIVLAEVQGGRATEPEMRETPAP